MTWSSSFNANSTSCQKYTGLFPFFPASDIDLQISFRDFWSMYVPIVVDSAVILMKTFCWYPKLGSKVKVKSHNELKDF